jgi:hypothetical protein
MSRDKHSFKTGVDFSYIPGLPTTPCIALTATTSSAPTSSWMEAHRQSPT